MKLETRINNAKYAAIGWDKQHGDYSVDLREVFVQCC